MERKGKTKKNLDEGSQTVWYVVRVHTYLHTDGIKRVVRANVTWNLQEQAQGGGLTTHPPLSIMYHLITQKHIESTATKKKEKRKIFIV